MSDLKSKMAEVNSQKAVLVKEVVAQISVKMDEVNRLLAEISELRDFAEIDVNFDDLSEYVREIDSQNPINTWNSSRC